MAYRHEKEQKDIQALVVDGFEKGIADSPFQGIGNIRNLNISYYGGVAYVNYKRKACTITYGTFTLTGSLSAGATSATLASVWPNVTGSYSTTFSNGDVKTVSYTNGNTAITWTGGLTGTATNSISVAGTMGKPKYATQSPAGIIYISDDIRQIWKQSAVNFSTFTILSGNYSQPISGLSFFNNYLIVIGRDSGGRWEICGDGTGDAGVTSLNWNSPALSSVSFTVTIATPAVFTANDHGLVAGQAIRLFTDGALPTGLTANTGYYVSSTGLTTNDFQLASSYAQAIAGTPVKNTSGSQSGSHTFQAAYGVWPIRNGTNIDLATIPASGATSGLISTYADGQNIGRGVWNSPSGYYNLVITQSGTNKQVVLAEFTKGSDVVSWTPELTEAATTVTAVVSFNGNVAAQNNVEHASFISKNDGNLYFCNGSNVATLAIPPFAIFDKNNFSTFSVNAAVLSLSRAETTTCLTELRNQLLVASNFNIYPWDRFSSQPQNPIPMQEQISSMINILNNVYVFAGNKGNIYLSNGYSVSPFKKMPDFIAGVIDPSWTWGGVMSHRLKLWFQALATNSQTGAPILAGIFSLGLVGGNGVSQETSGTLNMEAQNSFGLVSSTTTAPGLLIDNNSTALNYDNYYSAWSNGASSVGGIDFNDTTLWSSNEPTIETDIIPIGTAVNPKTFSSAEFKLDQPMKSGDSISLYARQSLSDTYQLIGITTTAVLSNFLQPIGFEKWQWIQFKATASCNATATSSSFIRIRELRIR
jgi:hypothetical protein